MKPRYDAIVAGLGAMGSSALFHLARRGARVAGFDRFAPPHNLGSSHGETRMIREAYYEHPSYVPLLRRAYDLWHELSARAGKPVIVETGGIFAGPMDGELVPGIIRSAGEHGIPIEDLSHNDAAARFPWLRIDESHRIVTEPRAGFIYPELCIEAHLAGARDDGAEIHTNEAIVSWSAEADSVVVKTTNAKYVADRLILTTGAWIVDTMASIGVDMVVERQPLFWFTPVPNVSLPSSVWALEFEHGKLLYGFPASRMGVKVAIHYGGVQRTTAEEIDRTVHDIDSQFLRRFADQHLPGVLGEISRGAICMYTNSPDLHFIFDAHPKHDNVLVVSACSGHGFKFSSAIGEAAAEWARDGDPRADMSLFSLERFSR